MILEIILTAMFAIGLALLFQTYLSTSERRKIGGQKK